MILDRHLGEFLNLLANRLQRASIITVSDTLTSDVASMSTGVSKRSKISKCAAGNHAPSASAWKQYSPA